MQSALSPERETFKKHLQVAEEYAEGIKDVNSGLFYDDFFPRTPIAHAAYRQVAYGETNHPYTDCQDLFADTSLKAFIFQREGVGSGGEF